MNFTKEQREFLKRIETAKTQDELNKIRTDISSTFKADKEFLRQSLFGYIECKRNQLFPKPILIDSGDGWIGFIYNGSYLILSDIEHNDHAYEFYKAKEYDIEEDVQGDQVTGYRNVSFNEFLEENLHNDVAQDFLEFIQDEDHEYFDKMLQEF